MFFGLWRTFGMSQSTLNTEKLATGNPNFTRKINWWAIIYHFTLFPSSERRDALSVQQGGKEKKISPEAFYSSTSVALEFTLSHLFVSLLLSLAVAPASHCVDRLLLCLNLGWDDVWRMSNNMWTNFTPIPTPCPDISLIESNYCRVMQGQEDQEAKKEKQTLYAL